MNHPVKAPYAVAINTQDLKTSGRRAEVARRLLAGEHKQEIIAFLMDTFGMPYKNAVSEYRQGYTYVWQQSELVKEDVRKLNLARLEELFDRAEQDAMLMGKDYYNTQLKNIDLTNKTCGVYLPDEDKQNSPNEFTIDLNLNNKTSDK